MLRLVCLLSLLAVSGCAGSRVVAPTPEAAAHRAALLDLREADQAPRLRYIALLKRYDYVPPDSLRQPLAREVLAADSSNRVALEALVAARGWPRLSDVGWHAASAAYLVVQHADLATQLRYRPLLAAAVAAEEAEAAWLAEMDDRIAVRQDRPQPYGSQIQTGEDGTRRFYPMLDPATVDARRAAVGLEPLADYARRMDVVYAPER